MDTIKVPRKILKYKITVILGNFPSNPDSGRDTGNMSDSSRYAMESDKHWIKLSESSSPETGFQSDQSYRPRKQKERELRNIC